MIPCFVGDYEPDLVRVSSPIIDERSELWLIIHEDLRRAPRIRAVVDRIVALFERQRRALNPKRRRT
jgi:hypothetical protein